MTSVERFATLSVLRACEPGEINKTDGPANATPSVHSHTTKLIRQLIISIALLVQREFDKYSALLRFSVVKTSFCDFLHEYRN